MLKIGETKHTKPHNIKRRLDRDNYIAKFENLEHGFVNTCIAQIISEKNAAIHVNWWHGNDTVKLNTKEQRQNRQAQLQNVHDLSQRRILLRLKLNDEMAAYQVELANKGLAYELKATF